MTEINRLPDHSNVQLRVNHASNAAAANSGLPTAHRCALVLMSILLMFAGLTARAQELAATLSGMVTDSSGAVVPHAAITLSLNGVNGTARQVESDGAGNYTVTNLTAGTYALTVVAPGFATYKEGHIVLDVAEKHSVNIALKAGAVSTTVTVEDNPVSVDTDTSAQAGTISGQQVRA
jgi:hypothetical protein